jgi:hemoglobin/transferrin/lactoferrin receptor protein
MDGSPSRGRALGFAVLLLALVTSGPLAAQENRTDPDSLARGDTLVYEIDPVIVTATRGPREVSETPRPVSVLSRVEVRELAPNTVSDLFTRLPGLDVTGVGVNQARPAIRGQRGQRILLMQDGMRLNNSRRQQDFGELPALVDVTGVDRVEIVRGPASVLYGSDAIGGVINIITRAPEREGIHGMATYRYGNLENQQKGSARVYGRQGRLSFQAGGTLRNADPYEAPAGTFGAITLDDDVTVNDTGVQDRSGDLLLGWDFTENVYAYGKFEYYDAEEAGFGSVDPEAYDPDAFGIDILYPDQTFRKFTFGFRADEMETPVADRVEVTTYGQENERTFTTGLFVPFGIPGNPAAGVAVDSENFTDIRTLGLRAEARKLVSENLLLTYGVDAFRDRVEGTDVTTTVTTGFGPPQTEIDNTPALPEATFLNAGAFLQAEVDLGDRVTLIGGGRYTRIAAETFETPNYDGPLADATDGQFVAAVNGLVDLTDELSLIASVGQAFRAPNLVERFFGGQATTGGFQVANPDLAPETSDNIDLGLRYSSDRFGFEVFAFRNNIENGIRIQQLPEPVEGQPAFQNVNVDRLRFQGVEVHADARLGAGFTALASYTNLDSEDVDDPENPVGDTFSTKTTASLRWDHPGNRFWLQWDSRFQGDQREVNFIDNPVGDFIPSFNVHNLRGGVRLFETGGTLHRINLALTNVTNELYAEATNTGFFRPAPMRNVTLTYELSF